MHTETKSEKSEKECVSCKTLVSKIMEDGKCVKCNYRDEVGFTIPYPSDYDIY